jgi:cytochrome c556
MRPIRPAPLALAVALAVAAGAVAQTPAQNAADSIKARQTHYKEIGKSAKGVFDELKKPDPSVPTIQNYAKVIASYGPQIAAWFPKGTGSEAGVKTAARAEIWAKPQDFARRVDAFKVETATFNAVAQKGDLTAIKAEAPKLGATCKGCHDDFRVRDQD